MSAVMITGGLFTHAEKTAAKLATSMGMNLITDMDIIDRAARQYPLTTDDLIKIVQGETFSFNRFTHKKEKGLSFLRQILAERLEKGNCVFSGVLGHLVPPWVTHVLKVLIIGNKQFRISQALAVHGLSEQEACARIDVADRSAILWSLGLTGKSAWDDSLYDIVIPADKTDENRAMDLIAKHTKNLPGVTADVIRQETVDFQLAAGVSVALSSANISCDVSVKEGHVVVSADSPLFFPGRFKQTINEIAAGVSGGKPLEIRTGADSCAGNISLGEPSARNARVLLVDDEKRYVETLSERLKIRQVPSDVVFSGEDALGHIDRQNTEIMVLDLKMPGIGGIDVLREIKATRPGIEVIILTGQGSEEDKKTCLELGAFAYLERPVDIDVLTRTMREAQEKIRMEKQPALRKGLTAF